jgi:hypothetical protein
LSLVAKPRRALELSLARLTMELTYEFYFDGVKILGSTLVQSGKCKKSLRLSKVVTEGLSRSYPEFANSL